MNSLWRFLERIGQKIRHGYTFIADLFGLIFIAYSASWRAFAPGRRKVFWRMFRRQIVNTGIRALWINAILAIAIGAALLSQVHALAGKATFHEIYADLFILVVVRELGPLISGIILITRAGASVTAEIAHAQLLNDFRSLRNLGINPVTLYLAPVFFAFPLSLLAMFVYFNLLSILSAYAMIWYQDADVAFIPFVVGILDRFTTVELAVTSLKGWIGGGLIGLVAIHYGAQVKQRFTEVSHALSAALTMQLALFFIFNVLLSILAYRV
ncbi:ABC transporter permease [Magnetococcales bacterium HHB-1]